jgi:hypothetical protein
MDTVEMKPFVLTGPEARRALRIGNTKYWALVKAGKIELAEIGGRKMPTYASIERLATPTAQAA